jgi:hypothetical protein
MHPDSSMLERFEVPANARHVFPRGKLAVEQARLIAAARCGRTLHSEVVAR